MLEYQENGDRLGGLLNPQNQTVEIYRPSHPIETQQAIQQISGADVLPGFTLMLTRIFS